MAVIIITAAITMADMPTTAATITRVATAVTDH
jgi:hypothetical protein